MNTAISTTPAVNKVTNHEYFNHFEGVDDIHHLLKNKQYNQAIEKIQKLCKAVKNEKFPLNKGSYTRNILSKKDGYWLSFLNWDKNVATPVHGHPGQAFLYAAKGELEIKNYDNESLAVKDTETLTKGDFTFSHGAEDRFDNAVHQISTAEQSLTLHFYSDDPTKGKLFKKN